MIVERAGGIEGVIAPPFYMRFFLSWFHSASMVLWAYQMAVTGEKQASFIATNALHLQTWWWFENRYTIRCTVLHLLPQFADG